MLRTCQNCQNDFEVHKPSSPKKFCNSSCACSANNRKYPKKKKAPRRPCRWCEAPCRNSRAQTCAEHIKANQVREITLREVSERISAKGKHPSWRWAFVRSMCRKWNKGLTKKCQVCGYSTHVEMAHIKGLESFSLDTPLKKVNDPTNILVLCRNHHWELDHGVIGIEDIPSRL